MVGASFEEIAAEASAAVQREIDKQLQEVTPSITRALKDGAAALTKANTALVAVRGRVQRYRFAILFLLTLCALEGGCLAALLFRH